jgi:hypothetical protein
VPVVDVDLTSVRSWDDFHDTFARALGFPDFYGRNMAAWVDCMTRADYDEGMTGVVVEDGDILTLHLIGAERLRARAPDLYAAMIDWAAFVNWRRIDVGERPILAISYYEPGAGSSPGWARTAARSIMSARRRLGHRVRRGR